MRKRTSSVISTPSRTRARTGSSSSSRVSSISSSRSRTNLGLTTGRRKNKTDSKNPQPYVWIGRAMPRKIGAILVYNERVTFDNTMGSNGQYQFSANGLYDPNITGTGHQPLYFDQFMAIYDHYTVLGSKCTATLIPDTTNGGSASTPRKFTFWMNDDTSVAIGNIDTMTEQPGAKMIHWSPSSTGPLTLTQTWGAYAYFGGNPLANDNLQGTASANPTEQSIYQLTVNAVDGISATVNFLDVYIEYTVVFDELKDISSS